jgi:hypothetical protein
MAVSTKPITNKYRSHLPRTTSIVVIYYLIDSFNKLSQNRQQVTSERAALPLPPAKRTITQVLLQNFKPQMQYPKTLGAYPSKALQKPHGLHAATSEQPPVRTVKVLVPLFFHGCGVVSRVVDSEMFFSIFCRMLQPTLSVGDG